MILSRLLIKIYKLWRSRPPRYTIIKIYKKELWSRRDCFAVASPPWLIRYAHRHINICLSPAVRTLEPRVLIPRHQNKNKTPIWAFDFYGGVEGIRTLDTVAGIPHFQCGALDQLCDDSKFYKKLFFVWGIVRIFCGIGCGIIQ